MTGRDVPVLRLFQSTRPIRGATTKALGLLHKQIKFQSTRPIRGATPSTKAITYNLMQFQSTRPIRGATRYT